MSNTILRVGIISCLSATFVFINLVVGVCVVHVREHSNEPRSPSNPAHSIGDSSTEPRGTDWLVCMIGLVPLLCSPSDPCSVTLSTANGTAPRSSNHLPASARPRPDRQKHDPLLRLHDPYEPRLSLSEFGDLVRHSFPTGPEPHTPPQNQEAGQAPTRKLPRRKDRSLWGFILQVVRPIFSWLQMGLPSMYFHRVASIIQKSEISIKDFASIQRPGTSQGFFGMIKLAGGVSMPKINKIHSIQRFKKKWKAFVMRCMEEWRNLNVISTLLLR